MSREAQQWCAQLPASATRTLIAFRVLDKLADAHHTDTDHAYRDIKKMANELEVDVRTIQRALRELEKSGLLLPGDPRVLPRTIPVNRAPTAYRLPWRQSWLQPQLGVTAGVTPTDPVDNSSWGDKNDRSGVTPAVAHRTQEPEYPSTSATTDRGCAHEWSRRFGVCVYCGARKPA